MPVQAVGSTAALEQIAAGIGDAQRGRGVAPAQHRCGRVLEADFVDRRVEQPGIIRASQPHAAVADAVEHIDVLLEKIDAAERAGRVAQFEPRDEFCRCDAGAEAQHIDRRASGRLGIEFHHQIMAIAAVEDVGVGSGTSPQCVGCGASRELVVALVAFQQVGIRTSG